jgi:hypothetical protein
MYELEPEAIDRLNDSKKRELLEWLQEIVLYVENSLGLPATEIRSDPVMDQIIGTLKAKQRRAARVSRPSWMATGFNRCDDKHV